MGLVQSDPSVLAEQSSDPGSTQAPGPSIPVHLWIWDPVLV